MISRSLKKELSAGVLDQEKGSERRIAIVEKGITDTVVTEVETGIVAEVETGISERTRIMADHQSTAAESMNITVPGHQSMGSTNLANMTRIDFKSRWSD